MVEYIEEVRSELELHPLSDREVLLHTDIKVDVAGSDYRALCLTCSERTRIRILE